ncbi:hypothetical protein ElyMa_006569400 [Elysia marginata]|uniref:Uncharacterized protein n=1 Tax=Elysia marginata TaxID=1093978 RepID=A0AAV4IC19_9GAST|nr:hypothetical protein ElyMa_006569400 [Elysia marginata]
MSNRRFRNCEKNPGHHTFIPAREFSITDLPVPLKSDVVLRYVTNYSARTVRLRTSYTSLDRPDYAGYRGSCTLRVASGWVCAVSFLGGPCKCLECFSSGSRPADRSWEVTVATSCHAVFNTEEAKKTGVDFFYEDEDSPKSGKMRTLWGHEVEYADPPDDKCLFGCITHDEEFAVLLENLRKERVDLWEDILNVAPFDMEHSQCIAISHPHGLQKHITVGQQIEIVQRPAGSQPYYTYTADTCPGSTGGPVLVLPGRDCPDPGWLPIVLHHRGSSQEGYNFSGERSSMGV